MILQVKKLATSTGSQTQGAGQATRAKKDRFFFKKYILFFYNFFYLTINSIIFMVK